MRVRPGALVRAGHEVTVVTAATSTAASAGARGYCRCSASWDVGAFLRPLAALAAAPPQLVGA